MFVLSLLSYKFRTKTAKTSFIYYKQAVYTVYTLIGHLWNFTVNCRIYPLTFVFYMLHVTKPS